jgi:hypothetical protein
MRVSVQLRRPDGTAAGQRWATSLYLDETSRAFRLPLRGFVPLGHRQPLTDTLHGLDSILFVIDHVNAAMGTSGMFWLNGVRLSDAPQVRTDSNR